MTEASTPSQPDASPGRPRAGSLLVFLVVVLIGAVMRVGLARGPELIAPAPDPRGFRFQRVDAATGMPVRYNPCAPVHYTINPALAPKTAISDVHTAFEITGGATGIDFVFDGTTTEAPSLERISYRPSSYGRRWAPILIAFTNGAPSLDGNTEVDGKHTIGQAGSSYEVNDAGAAVFVTGTAVFDAGARLTPGFGKQTWGQLILHELGHVVGLGHVENPESVMNDTIDVSHSAWGPGDRAGLWELGDGGSCIDTPPLP